MTSSDQILVFRGVAFALIVSHSPARSIALLARTSQVQELCLSVNPFSAKPTKPRTISGPSEQRKQQTRQTPFLFDCFDHLPWSLSLDPRTTSSSPEQESCIRDAVEAERKDRHMIPVKLKHTERHHSLVSDYTRCALCQLPFL